LATIGLATVAFLGVVISLGVFWRTNRQARKVQADEFLWRVMTLWDASEMRRYRIRAASALLAKSHESRETYEVLNYLELVGYLVRTKTISAVGAWTHFSEYAVGYWWAAREEIDHWRGKDITVFSELEGLVMAYPSIDAEQRRRVCRVRWIDLLAKVLTASPIKEDLARFRSLPAQVAYPWPAWAQGDFLQNEKDLELLFALDRARRRVARLSGGRQKDAPRGGAS
jgi:hypothetical protein